MAHAQMIKGEGILSRIKYFQAKFKEKRNNICPAFKGWILLTEKQYNVPFTANQSLSKINNYSVFHKHAKQIPIVKN